MAEQALRDRAYHEWGYRYNGSPLIEDLTIRQRAKIHLAAQAEQYISHQSRNARQRPADTDPVTDHYDVSKSTEEWARQHQ